MAEAYYLVQMNSPLGRALRKSIVAAALRRCNKYAGKAQAPSHASFARRAEGLWHVFTDSRCEVKAEGIWSLETGFSVGAARRYTGTATTYWWVQRLETRSKRLDRQAC